NFFPFRAYTEIRIKISSRKAFLAFSDIPICSSMERISFSFGSTVSPVKGSVSLLRLQYASILSRSEEHTSELQSRFDLVCRLLLEKKNKNSNATLHHV